MRVLIQLRPPQDVVASVLDPGVVSTVADVAGDLPGVLLDQTFDPVPLPGLAPMATPRSGGLLGSLGGSRLGLSRSAEHASVLVRGEIADDDLPTRWNLLTSTVREVTGVFSDPSIGTTLACDGNVPVGDWHDVERLLHVGELQANGYDGDGVRVAIVDGGINYEHVAGKLGRPCLIDGYNSWNPRGTEPDPGRYPVGHGSLCAFNTLIAAPKAVLLDIPILRTLQSTTTGLLSDAVAAYAHLWQVLMNLPEASRTLVVSNSWGLNSRKDDLPPGHPGNYAGNPMHPFNVALASLEVAGADIVFSAGNGGQDCPNSNRDAFYDIVGANGHPKAVTVAGVDIHGTRAGYSTKGPARLADNKPDISSYTHFLGSEATELRADTGTSTACPVAAGVIAALRTRHPGSHLFPSQLRTLLQRTAEDRSTAGFDYEYGYGIINPPALIAALDKFRQRAA
ncbi:S8 family serine peptidase [Nonomuraea sp. NPDC050404]|uniref:S8 family serine peptidase n=1 Tax=Nonomuraea sp. NPDC050404 TaxID=3155783 RepID=UPI0033D4C231